MFPYFWWLCLIHSLSVVGLSARYFVWRLWVDIFSRMVGVQTLRASLPCRTRYCSYHGYLPVGELPHWIWASFALIFYCSVLYPSQNLEGSKFPSTPQSTDLVSHWNLRLAGSPHAGGRRIWQPTFTVSFHSEYNMTLFFHDLMNHTCN